MADVDIRTLVPDFARGMERADAKRPQQVSARTGKAYQPGLGPHTEAGTIDLVLAELASDSPDIYDGYVTGLPYPNVKPIQRCDLLVGGWAVEVKMLRIMGDNGKPNDNMLMHILSPYSRHRSALTDCTKLAQAPIGPRKAILVFGYEYDGWPMSPVIEAFQTLAQEKVGLGKRHHATVEGLIHPVHQRGGVFGWEILGFA